MPRRRSLTDEQLADAALAVIDRDGPDALSMRTVARQLGVSTMALYRYVSTREQLEGLVIEKVLNGVDLTAPPGTAWQDRLVLLAERARAAAAAHPGITPLILTHRMNTRGSIRWGEAVLTTLEEAGFTGPRRTVAFHTMLCFLIGTMQTAYLTTIQGSPVEAMARRDDGAYPLVTQAARDRLSIDPAAEFSSGMAILLDGLNPR